MKDLLISHFGNEVITRPFAEILERRGEIYEVTRRTFNSIKKDLDRGDVYIRCDVSSNRLPYLACREGWQELSLKMLKRLFAELPLKRVDHIKGYVLPSGEQHYKVIYWTWRLWCA